MKKLNLTPQQICDTEFKIDLKGYSPEQVDTLLDSVLDDYQTMEENLQEALDTIASLKSQIKDLKQENLSLEANHRGFDLANTTTYSSVDLLKRVSRLEELYYKK